MSEPREAFYLTSSEYDCSISFDDNYTILHQIGQAGQYGVVYRCKRKSDDLIFAVKIIDKTKIYKMESSPLKESCMKSLKDEVAILQRLQHHYIIKLHDLYETENNLFIIMDECKGGELFDKIIEKQSYSELEAKKIFKMIVEALFYLHTQHNIIHCDIKPDNILFTNNSNSSHIKLCDFGMAKICPPFTSCKQLCGTPYYTAPEIIQCHYSHSADMWSLGALLFTMIFGFPAFYVDINQYQGMEETYNIYKLIKKGFDPSIKNGFGAWFPRQIVEMKGISSECMDLMSNLMIQDITKRYTAKEVLQHEWLTGAVPNIDLFGLSLANFTVSHQLKYIVASLYEERFNYKDIRVQFVDRLRQIFGDKDKMSYQEFEGLMLKCCNLRLNKDEIHAIFNGIDVDLSGYIHFKQVLNALIYDHLISQNERLFQLLSTLKNEDMEKIMKCIDHHIQIQNAQNNYDVFLAAIHPKQINFTFMCHKSCNLLINGYINSFSKKIKFDTNISIDICGVIVSFYDKNMYFTTNI